MTEGPGEAAARAKQRRMWVRTGWLALAGAAVGFTTALLEGKNGKLLEGGTIPPAFAIIGTLTLLIAVGIGSWKWHRDIDEVQRLDHLMAGTMGANVMLAGYPAWLLLWKGGLVPEPNHFILFGAVFATTLITYAWRKLR